jgi:tRNA modification GTPase
MTGLHEKTSDTIAAVSTPPGNGGIGIIRISGNNAFEIAEKIYKGKHKFSEFKPNTINYGWIVEPFSGENVDEILITKLSAPKTYTGEDTVEINCHGGINILKRILDMVTVIGARPADPGEFTRRAFLNSRIDLSRAEAVIDLIKAKTDESARAALRQLEGKLGQRLKAVREKLISLIADIEVTIDYPELELDDITKKGMIVDISDILDIISNTVKGFDRGRIIREGITAAIAGKPNVGKSSLLNELTGKERSIVTDIPGTTRDIIEEYVNIRGIPVLLVDTAGIRSTGDYIEGLGVASAKKKVSDADLVLVMLDAGKELEKEDFEILEMTKGKKRLVILNKTDISSVEKMDKIEKSLTGLHPIRMSVKEGTGMSKLEEEIEKAFISGEVKVYNEILLTNTRHKSLLDKAIDSLENAKYSMETGVPEDICIVDIKAAADSIGYITGESVTSDVIDEIFSRFCIGK